MNSDTGTSLIVQGVVAGVVLLAALTVLVRRPRLGGTRPWLVAAALVVMTAVGAAFTWTRTTNDQASRRQLADAIPRVSPQQLGGYAGSDACRACHPREYATWHASYHRTMTQRATPQNVIGDFDDVDVELDGRVIHLFRRGDEFWANVVDPAWEKQYYDRGVDPRDIPDPPRVDQRIVMTTGRHHYQTYWVSDGGDRKLATFPLVWLGEEQDWYPRRAAFMLPPGILWAPQVWNAACINCHSVAGEPIEGQKGIFDTTVAELGIACEACHGPGAEHVRVNHDPRRRYGLHRHDGDPGDPTIVNPARLPADRASQICGRCHSVSLKRVRPYDSGQRYRPGDDLDATHWIVRQAERFMTDEQRQTRRQFEAGYGRQNPGYFEGRFWPDGMVRVSGRDYTAMIESACYQGGTLSCLSCHSMHDSDPNDQLAAGMETDQACFQCHPSYADDVATHTHHPAASEGSRCVNCHMPHTTYGLLKTIRSHLIDSPSVRTSVETGRPNACNLCHLDRSLAWVQDHLQSWYGTPPVELTGDQRDVPASLLWLLSGDANQRGLVAWSMGWPPAQEASRGFALARYLAELLDDPYDAVRYIVRRSIRTLPGFEDLAYDSRDPPEARRRARQAALERWTMLWGDRTALSPDEISRLLAQRDDRPVELKE